MRRRSLSLLVLTAAGELVRRAEDPCGPQLAAAAAENKGGTDTLAGNSPSNTHTHTHSHIHTHHIIFQQHQHTLSGGERKQEPVCSRRFEPLPEDRHWLRINPHSVDSDSVTPLTTLIASLNFDQSFSS